MLSTTVSLGTDKRLERKKRPKVNPRRCPRRTPGLAGGPLSYKRRAKCHEPPRRKVVLSRWDQGRLCGRGTFVPDLRSF